MTKQISMTMALVLSLGACASPYADAIKDATARCGAGDRAYCDSLPGLRAQDAAYQERQAAQASALAAALLAGAAVGAAAAAASQPHYSPIYVTPVYTPPAPVFCNSMQLGGGFTSTSCY
jgi:hypothetical protein